MIIYQITLPEHKDKHAFVKFMQEDYFPSVHKEATRVGQVTNLTLLERKNVSGENNQDYEFYWLVGWTGLSVGDAHVDDAKVLQKFEGFNAEIKRIGYFDEIASWHEENKE